MGFFFTDFKRICPRKQEELYLPFYESVISTIKTLKFFPKYEVIKAFPLNKTMCWRRKACRVSDQGLEWNPKDFKYFFLIDLRYLYNSIPSFSRSGLLFVTLASFSFSIGELWQREITARKIAIPRRTPRSITENNIPSSNSLKGLASYRKDFVFFSS